MCTECLPLENGCVDLEGLGPTMEMCTFLPLCIFIKAQCAVPAHVTSLTLFPFTN